MSNLIIMEKVGYAKPELRYTASGKPVLSFRVSDQKRRYNEQTQQWEDAGETLWLSVSYFGTDAETLANQLTSKTASRITLTGELKARSYVTGGGEKREVVEVTAKTIALNTRNQNGVQVQQQPSQAWGNQGQDWPVVAQPGAGTQPAQPAPHAQQAMWTQADWAGGQPVADDEPPF